jgi:hypothetical protein
MLRCANRSSFRRTSKYASFLTIRDALQQPAPAQAGGAFYKAAEFGKFSTFYEFINYNSQFKQLRIIFTS